jgi:DNA-binding NtrC family response regulator
MQEAPKGDNGMAVVLVVEDEEQVLVLAKSYLEEQGHATRTANTVEGALAVLDQGERIDVLFTDIGLNGDIHAGLELAKRAVEQYPEIGVLYSTGQAVTDGMKAMFVERSALLEKPYTVEQLLTSLSVHFRINPTSRR